MIEFREFAIESITEDLDGKTIYVGTESGDLAAFDMRTGLNGRSNLILLLFFMLQSVRNIS